MAELEKNLEMLPLAELAKRAGVPLSTADRYIRRNKHRFHPMPGKRGKRYPIGDAEVLQEIYAQAPKSRVSGKKYSIRSSRNVSLHSSSGRDSAAAIRRDKESPRVTLEAVESNASLKGSPQGLIERRLQSMEERLSSLSDQIDEIVRMMTRIWESQLTFAKSGSNRPNYQEVLVDMLSDRNKQLEDEIRRLRQVGLMDEVAATVNRRADAGRNDTGQTDVLDGEQETAGVRTRSQRRKKNSRGLFGRARK